jgi:hypothetical protein
VEFGAAQNPIIIAEALPPDCNNDLLIGLTTISPPPPAEVENDPAVVAIPKLLPLVELLNLI